MLPSNIRTHRTTQLVTGRINVPFLIWLTVSEICLPIEHLVCYESFTLCNNRCRTRSPPLYPTVVMSSNLPSPGTPSSNTDSFYLLCRLISDLIPFMSTMPVQTMAYFMSRSRRPRLEPCHPPCRPPLAAWRLETKWNADFLLSVYRLHDLTGKQCAPQDRENRSFWSLFFLAKAGRLENEPSAWHIEENIVSSIAFRLISFRRIPELSSFFRLQ